MSFFEELKRRNVFRVGIAYVISAWVLLQFVDLVLENIQAPDWVIKVFMLALAIGFPLAIFFAWAFEMTPEGIKKEKDVDRITVHHPAHRPQAGPVDHRHPADRGGLFCLGQLRPGKVRFNSPKAPGN